MNRPNRPPSISPFADVTITEHRNPVIVPLPVVEHRAPIAMPRNDSFFHGWGPKI